jgi:serine/threonine protein kinase
LKPAFQLDICAGTFIPGFCALNGLPLLAVQNVQLAVPYKEFFKADDGDLCLVMAYCEGGDLFRYIKQLR